MIMKRRLALLLIFTMIISIIPVSAAFAEADNTDAYLTEAGETVSSEDPGSGTGIGFEYISEQFRTPDSTYGAGVRYVIPEDFNVNSQEYMDAMENEIRELHDLGYARMEIENRVERNSEEFTILFRHIYAVANEVGMKIDFRIGGTGSVRILPLGGFGGGINSVTGSETREMYTADDLTFEGGYTLSDGSQIKGNVGSEPTGAEIYAVQAVRYTEDIPGNKMLRESITLDPSLFTLEYQKVEEEGGEDATGSEEETEEGDSSEDADSSGDSGDSSGDSDDAESSGDSFPGSGVTYDIAVTYHGSDTTIGMQGETWSIICYYLVPTANEDFYSVASAETFTKKVEQVFADPELNRLVKENGGYMTSDGGDGNQRITETSWSDELEEKFSTAYGYDLKEYLPVIYSGYTMENGDEARVKNDWRNAFSLLSADYNSYITDWAENEYNSSWRAQVGYSTDLEDQTVAMSVGQSDVESLWNASELDSYLAFTSVRNLAGKAITANECAAISYRYGSEYAFGYKDLISVANASFVAGVNQQIFHVMSFPYSEQSPWPGFLDWNAQFMDWGKASPGYCNSDLVVNYINRAQTVLQTGTPKRDFLIYIQTNEDRYEVDDAVAFSGYTYDIVSDALLTTEKAQIVENGVIDPDGGEYRAFVISRLADGQYMDLNTAYTILKYAENAVPVIVVGEENIPVKTTSYAQCEQDQELADIFTRIGDMGMLTVISSETELPETLESIGINANLKKDTSSAIESYMVKDEEGSSYYFLYNADEFSQALNGTYQEKYTEEEQQYYFPEKVAAVNYRGEEISQTVSLKGTGTPYVMDLWTGEITPIDGYTQQDGYVDVTVSLVGGESQILALVDGSPERGAASPRIAETGEPFELNNWNLKVESYTPANEFGTVGIAGAESNITVLETKLDSLRSWSEIDEIGPEVSGIGYYTTTFTMDEKYDGAYLNIGDVFDLARVYVNDQEVILNQNRKTADLKGVLKTGENTLMIVAASDYMNQYAANGGTSIVLNYGLFGPVLITPYRTDTAAVSIVDKVANPDMTARPLARMWFPDLAAGYTEEDGSDYLWMVAENIQEMYDGGFGGLEITPIQDASDIMGINAYNYGWGTQAYVNVIKTVLETANNHNEEYKLAEDADYRGMEIDFSISPHWPPAANSITFNDSGAQQQIETVTTYVGINDLFTDDGLVEEYPLSLPAQRLYTLNFNGVFLFKDTHEATTFLMTGTDGKVVFESMKAADVKQGRMIATAGVPGEAVVGADGTETRNVKEGETVVIRGNWGSRYISEYIGSYKVNAMEMMGQRFINSFEILLKDGFTTQDGSNAFSVSVNNGIVTPLASDIMIQAADGTIVETLEQGYILMPIYFLTNLWGDETTIDDEGNVQMRERDADSQYEYVVSGRDIAAYILDQLGIEYTEENLEITAMENKDRIAQALTDFIICSSYRQGSGQIQSGSESILEFPTYCATDYFSEAGAQTIIDYWENNVFTHDGVDTGVKELMKENAQITGGISALFEDSIEAGYSKTVYTEGFIEYAAQYLGYSEEQVRTYLPIMTGAIKASWINSETDVNLSGFVTDYQEVMGNMYENNHARKISDWAKTFGYSFRAQAYSLVGLDTMSAANNVDIPEGDNIVTSDGFRQLQTVVNLKSNGKTILSNESSTFGTNLTDQTVIGNVFTRLNKDYGDGVTRILLHASQFKRSYDGYKSSWPGYNWTFAQYNNRQTWWDDNADLFTGYVANLQAVLQNGITRVEAAVMIDRADSYNLSTETRYFQLLNEGYSYDIMNQDIIEKDLQIGQNASGQAVLNSEGAAYQFLILHDVSHMTIGCANKILEIARAGIPVFVLNRSEVNDPGSITWNYYGSGLGIDSSESSEAVEAVRQDLLQLPNVYTIDDLTVTLPEGSNLISTLQTNQMFAGTSTTWSSAVQDALISILVNDYHIIPYNSYYTGEVYDCSEDIAELEFWSLGIEQMFGRGKPAKDVTTSGETFKGLRNKTKYDPQTGTYMYAIYNDTGEGASMNDCYPYLGKDITTTVTLTGGTPYAYTFDLYTGKFAPLDNYTWSEETDGSYRIVSDITVPKNEFLICIVKGADETSAALTDYDLEHIAYYDVAGKSVVTFDNINSDWNLDITVFTPGYMKDLQVEGYDRDYPADLAEQQYINDHKQIDPTESVKTSFRFSGNVLGLWSVLPVTEEQRASLENLYGVVYDKLASLAQNDVRNIMIGLASYSATIELTEDQIGDINTIIVDHNQDILSHVIINGVDYRNPDQISGSVIDREHALHAGENTIEIVIGSSLLGQNSTKAALNTGLNSVSIRSEVYIPVDVE